MDIFYLEEVTIERKTDIIEYIREFYQFGSQINGVGRLQDYVTEDTENFERWLTKIKEEEKEELHKKCYLFIRKKDNRLIGMVNIRISDNLKDYKYGHIGYSIRPTERNKGYGKIQFYFALNELKNNGINICEMNCERNNIFSKKIIKSLGGKYEKSINNEEYYLIDVEKILKKNLLYDNI